MRKKIKFLGICLLLAAALTACGKKEEVAVSLGKEKIYMDEVNFYTRMNQYEWEQAYADYLGEEMWTKDLDGSGKTLAAGLKDQVLDTVLQMHIFSSHAKDYEVELTKEEKKEISERTKSFLDSHEKSLLEAAGATEKLVQELLTRNALAEKVSEAIVADYEPKLPAESYAMKKMSYCLISTEGTFDAEGNHTPATAEEIRQAKGNAEKLAKAIQESGDFQGEVEKAGYVVVESYFLDDSAEGNEEAVVEAVKRLAVGETAGPIHTDRGYYLVRYDSDYDEAAAAQKKEALILEKKEAKCQETFEAWKKEAGAEVNQEAWDGLKVDGLLRG